MKNFWTRFLSGLLYASLITPQFFILISTFKVLISIFSIIVIKEYFNLINYKNYLFFLTCFIFYLDS